MCHVVFDLALLFKAHCSEASFDSRAGGLIQGGEQPSRAEGRDTVARDASPC